MTAGGGRQGATAISAPETASPTKLWGGLQSLTIPSWDLPGVSHLRPVPLRRCTAHLELCSHRPPRNLSGLYLGGACCLGRGNPMWSIYCKCSHTCQWCLFAVALPAHSTPEPVSPKKWPLSPPHVRSEIRPWREAWSRGGQPRQSKAERTASKWQVQQIKILQLETVHLRGNCRLWEQVHAATRDCLTQNSLHTAHNNVKDVLAYVGGSFEQSTQPEQENRGITQFFSLLLLLILKILLFLHFF